MAPAFVHCPAYFAANGYREPANQETGPYAEVFNCTYWQRINTTPKLKNDLDTYMSAHKKGGSSLVDLLPYSELVAGYNSAFPVLLVDIGGGVGHQCKELRSRYPSLPGDIVVQDLQCVQDVGLAGVRGMAYNFFDPQPIRGKILAFCLNGWTTLTLQTLDSTITVPFYTTGRTKNVSAFFEMWPKPCVQATPNSWSMASFFAKSNQLTLNLAKTWA